MHGVEEQLVFGLQQFFAAIGWTGVVIAMAIESACIPLPSEVTMPLAGWMLIQARGLSVWNVLWAGLYGALGCTTGSALTYWVGAKGGRPFLERYGRYVLISVHDIETADRWFSKYGEATAFFSRLLPIVRTFISLPAGVARMNFFRFALLSFVGSFIWCAALAWLGFVFGVQWREVREIMRPWDIPIAVAFAALVLLYIYRHVHQSHGATSP